MTGQLHDTLGYNQLDEALDGRPFRYYEQVTSTNDIAQDWQMANPYVPSGTVVIADEQIGGRGRHARPWQTPVGQGIAMSVILRPNIDANHLQRLTMMAGVAIAEVVRDLLPVEKADLVGLKWPNDVILDGKKLAGILSEAIWFGNDLQAVILGIGLNVSVDFANTELATIATSLNNYTTEPVSRLTLIHHILEQLDKWESRLEADILRDTWREWLLTIGQTIQAKTELRGIIEGVAEDVDANGALEVRTADGNLERVTVGEVLPQ